ncbi:MAG: LysR family transcriptional regulator [Candidatus Thiodiazotropha sp. (ex Ctena orbiculata)]|nr:LysR family transcriptional regulator [Candidatus Thiodiazotropha taylori]MBT3035386.1 LysR family transcriptional regulator [Candidatus Thiodiazotropha taylori]
MSKNLDIDLLRTLVAIADFGGFSQAAKRLHRTQSAISLQMKRLEESSGKALFRKAGRKRILTEEGELLLNYARRILNLNDEVASMLRPNPLQGHLRLGISQDIADRGLAVILAQFTRSHPAVRLDVMVDTSSRLIEAMGAERLDLAVAFQNPGDPGDSLGQIPLQWIVPDPLIWQPPQPLPLAMFTTPCVFRSRVVSALEQAGIPWRIAYTSPSLPGILAAVEAGLGVTARLAGEGSQLHGLPPLKPVELGLYRSPVHHPDVVNALETIVRDYIRSERIAA